MMDFISKDKNFVGVFEECVGDPTKGVDSIDVFNHNGVIFYRVIVSQKIDRPSPIFRREFVIKFFPAHQVPEFFAQALFYNG